MAPYVPHLKRKQLITRRTASEMSAPEKAAPCGPYKEKMAALAQAAAVLSCIADSEQTETTLIPSSVLSPKINKNFKNSPWLKYFCRK